MLSIFPTEKYQEYLKIVGCTSENKLDDLKIENIVKQAYIDFKKNEFSLDNLCSLGEYLFYKVAEQSSKFASTLLDCSELNYYLQIQDNDSDEFNAVMKRIETYFNGQTHLP